MQVVVSTAILLIATIIAASVFTAAALSELYTFQSTFKQVGSKNQAYYETSVTIIGEAKGSPSGEIEVWVKNTGTTSFTISASGDPQYWDVFITFPSGTYTRFPYSSSCTSQSTSPCFGVTLLNTGNNTTTWETGDTILLSIFTQVSLSSGSYQVNLSLSNGATAQDNFSF